MIPISGRTLPGAIDLEAGCYGLSPAAMVNWIRDFSNTYHSRTSRYPGNFSPLRLAHHSVSPWTSVIYTTTSWWETCTGNSAAFGSNNPLWIARWASSIGKLPAGWR